MTCFAKSDHYAVFVLLTVLMGCSAPAGGHHGSTVVGQSPAVALTSKPAQTLPVAAESRPDAPAAAKMLPVAYEVADERSSAPSTSSSSPAPLPEDVVSVAGQPTLLTGRPVANAADSRGEVAETVSLQSPYQTDDPSDPFLGRSELPVEQLVAEVQARNPSLQAASSAWRAAAQRYPQAVSLDDPMFTYMITPSNGLGMDNGGGWMVQASQKVPWAGKRALRGSAASAEADAMKGDIGDTRLRLAEAARMAFYDYYLAKRQMDVNTSTCQLVAQFREIALNKYRVGQAMEQDVLQADVEQADLEGRRTELTRDEQVAVARINTLLHREVGCPLPPPPAKITIPDSLPAAELLQQMATQSRPDLYAAQARIRAEQANLALACKEYYPDLNLAARYDGFMPQEMRPQIGMDLNIPVRYARRSAAVQEAECRVAQRCAEFQDRLDQVRYEVQSGLERVAQGQRMVRLYEEKILPAAQRSLDSALANYTSGKLDFLRLLDAERQLYGQHEMYHQSIAEFYRRFAELERAVGEPIGTIQ